MGLLSALFGGSSSSSTTSTADNRSVTDNSTGGGIGGTNNRTTVTIQDGSAVITPVVRTALTAARDVNVAALQAVTTGQVSQSVALSTLADVVKAQSANASGAETSRAALYAAAAVAGAVILFRGR